MPWTWWKKKPAQARTTITPKGSKKASSAVDLGELAPSAAQYLSHLCVVQSALAGRAGQLSEEAWSSQDADQLMLVAVAAGDRYKTLRDLLGEYDRDVHGALATPRETIHRHLERLESSRWYENVATLYVVQGFCRDFFLSVAEGLPPATKDAVRAVMEGEGEEQIVADVLTRVTQSNSRALQRLSLWSRRLVGDTMLICRDVLTDSDRVADEVSITLEPIFADVLAEHTKRLEKLGLQA